MKKYQPNYRCYMSLIHMTPFGSSLPHIKRGGHISEKKRFEKRKRNVQLHDSSSSNIAQSLSDFDIGDSS